MKYIVILIILLCYSVPGYADSYYVQDGGNLSYVKNGNSSTLQNVKEWQIWLYRKGEPASGNNRWGSIWGKSAGDVTEKLKSSQQFELLYNKGCDVCKASKTTFFNRLGPIAVIDAKQRKRNIPEKALEKIIEIQEKYDDIYQTYKTLNEYYFNPPEHGPNPFAGVGVVTQEYVDSFKDVFSKMSNLYEFMTQVSLNSDKTMRELDKHIKDMEQIKQQASVYQRKMSQLPAAKDNAGNKKTSFQDAGGKEIVQSVDFANNKLIVSQGYSGEAQTTYKVGLANIDRNNCKIKEGQIPGAWVVSVKGNRGSVEKSAPMFDKNITDNVSTFDILFKSKQEAESFVASLKKAK